MRKNILPTSFTLIVLLSISLINTGQAQLVGPGEQLEKVFAVWSSRLEMARSEVNADKQDFATFTRFYKHEIDSLHVDFINKADAHISVDDAQIVMERNKNYIKTLYTRFLSIKQEFPSSVDEYKNVHRPKLGGDSCVAPCYNTGFEDGTLNGWYAFYAENESPAAGPFNIMNVTGGYCGPVAKAGGPDIYEGNDYQVRITAGAATDYFLQQYASYSLPQVSPYGGIHSVMLGDSTRPDNGTAILSQSFMVTANTASLTYQFAVLLEHPSNLSHNFYTQPYFLVTILDQNLDTIPTCGTYAQSALNAFDKGYFSTYYPSSADSVYWKPWTLVNVPLKKYIGQCVTIIFETYDCALGGHFGYAYVDATCTPLALIASSPNFCGQDSISLTAPPGDSGYGWKGPKGGISGDTTGQTIWVKKPGVYTVRLVPVTGAACADTLSFLIGQKPGPPPKPDFHVNTNCAGQITHFTNTSNPLGGDFSWDFYDIGQYNDTGITNPTWTYASPGNYRVKLHELNNGCGDDTVITIHIDSSVVAGFNFANPCVGQAVSFTNSSQGATSYLWNFGNPPSAPHDTSTSKNSSHTFTGVGTYTVTLISKNGGTCPDTSKQAVTIYTYPKPTITGKNLVCPGYSDTLTAKGAQTYVWSDASTGSTDVVVVNASETVTVTASNGGCSHDTTFTISTNAPAAKITPTSDSVCAGTADTLTAGGGLSYKWSTKSAASSIIVFPSKPTTYTLYAKTATCSDSAVFTVGIIKQVGVRLAVVRDSICPGDSTTISAFVSGASSFSYSWNTGATTASINVTPQQTTPYTATINGTCNIAQQTITVNVVPYPSPVLSGPLWRCHGVRDTIQVSGGYSYKWSDGKTKTTYVTGGINKDSTIYVTVKNVLGCAVVDTYHIALRLPPIIGAISPAAIACAGIPVSFGVTNISGIQPYTYSWSPGGQTTDSISILNPDSATVYTVYVSNGCLSHKTVTITPDYPVLNACCNQTLIIENDTTTLTAYGTSTHYQWLEANQVLCLDPLCDSVRVTPKVTTTYTVIGTDKLGCETQQLITVIIDVPCFNPNIPNVFTPNFAGPYGKNNMLYIKTDNIDGWSMQIYDRWGKEVYTSTNQYQYWDGKTEGGSDAADGVYYYTISATCQNTTFKKEGFVQLIR